MAAWTSRFRGGVPARRCGASHPYEKVFVTLEGEATFTVGEDTREVSAGHQIVVAPANVPHKFVNSGNGPLRQVDIHPSGRIEQVDMPEES